MMLPNKITSLMCLLSKSECFFIVVCPDTSDEKHALNIIGVQDCDLKPNFLARILEFDAMKRNPSLFGNLGPGINTVSHFSSATLIKCFLICFPMDYRDFSVTSKVIISLFQTVRLSLSIFTVCKFVLSPIKYH